VITFLQYFEEAAKPRELVYHITDGNNLKSILSQGLIPNKLSNFEDVSSDTAHSKKSYSGVYVGRDLRELAMTVIDWNIIKLNNFGLVVVESRGYNQIFMDEDSLVDAIPSVDPDKIASELTNFVNSDFQNSKALGFVLVEFLKNIKKRFTFNEHQRHQFQVRLIKNAPIVLFRGVDKNKNADPEMVRRFLEHYGKTDTESWFREFFDSVSNLRFKSKQSENSLSGLELDSGRVKKTIGFSGNPKIVGMFRIKRHDSPDVIYSRLEPSEESAILETVQDAVDYYGED
jgi:hypothetical protein